jgi:hypothetical protein
MSLARLTVRMDLLSGSSGPGASRHRDEAEHRRHPLDVRGRREGPLPHCRCEWSKMKMKMLKRIREVQYTAS